MDKELGKEVRYLFSQLLGTRAARQTDRQEDRERVRGWVLLVFILFVFFFCSNIDLLFVIF